MNNPRGELRFLFFAAAATLLTGLTIALIWVGANFLSSPPVKAQLAAWTEGWFSGFEPPPHLVEANRLAGSPPFIPVTGSGLPVQASAQPALPTPTPTPTAAATGQPSHTPEAPLAPQGRLAVPSLGIDQTLLPVPVVEGDWDISALREEIGWLETTGAQPLDRYAMVFVGHVTLPSPSGPGPFLRLRELQPGDEIRYHLEDKTYVYRVEAREIVPPDSVDRLYVDDGEAIVLVTCSGWNYLAQQYDYRLLVVAKLMRTEKSAGAVE